MDFSENTFNKIWLLTIFTNKYINNKLPIVVPELVRARFTLQVDPLFINNLSLLQTLGCKIYIFTAHGAWNLYKRNFAFTAFCDLSYMVVAVKLINGQTLHV
jgi:hypothetical protein